MKIKSHLRSTLIVMGALLVTAHSLPSYANSISLTIQSVKHDKGTLYIQLFNGAENYKQGKAIDMAQVAAKSGDISVMFDNVKAGNYAIRYFHDENDNGSLDTNLFGIPTEGFGFSNNAKANFGPPSYLQMAFDVASEPVATQSTVNY